MSNDSFDFSYILNYLENIPLKFPEVYLESKSITGFSSNIIDEIQDLLKHIEFLENVIQELRFHMLKQSKKEKNLISVIERLTMECEGLQDVINSHEILNKDLKKVIEREDDAKSNLRNKIFEKDAENNELRIQIDTLNQVISNYEEMKRIQKTHIHQLEESVAKKDLENNDLTNQAYLFTPMIRKINRDYDGLFQEKHELENSLRLKINEFEKLEKKYLKVLRKNDSLTKESQKSEVELLESRTEIENLKTKIKNLRKTIKYSNLNFNERLPTNTFNPLINKRKTKSFVQFAFNPNVCNHRTFHDIPLPSPICKKHTLIEEIPQFYSPRPSSFNLDLIKTQSGNELPNTLIDLSGSSHLHQDSFGLKNQDKSTNKIVENIEVDHDDINESPKFARSKENEANMSFRTISTVEIDYLNPNPSPLTKSIGEDSYVGVNQRISISYPKEISNSDLTRKKLIEIDKKNKVTNSNPDGLEKNSLEKNQHKLNEIQEHAKKLSKMQRFMKITLNLIPSGMFFSKMMDISEDLMK